MIDPRVALVIAALYLAVWGVKDAVHGVEALGRKAKHAIVKIVHPHRHVDEPTAPDA